MVNLLLGDILIYILIHQFLMCMMYACTHTINIKTKDQVLDKLKISFNWLQVIDTVT